MARIIQIENGQLKSQHLIDTDDIRIGRSKNNQVYLKENVVSLSHAKIFTERDHKGTKIYFLMDLNSTNGSFINRSKISCKQLKHQDRIRFGHQYFTFIDDSMNLPS